MPESQEPTCENCGKGIGIQVHDVCKRMMDSEKKRIAAKIKSLLDADRVSRIIIEDDIMKLLEE